MEVGSRSIDRRSVGSRSFDRLQTPKVESLGTIVPKVSTAVVSTGAAAKNFRQQVQWCVWRKTATKSNQDRKREFELAQANFQETTREELLICLEGMLTDARRL